MTNCIFCKIINHEIPSDIIYEDDDVVAFLDIRPVNRGHTLVVPKKHVEDLLSADNETLGQTINRVKKIAAAVVAAVGAAGFNLGLNNGSAAGQVIFHLHFHIIPRFEKDHLKLWPQHEMEPQTRKEIAQQIKQQL